MEALSTTTYVQIKHLLYGGPGAADLEDARVGAGEAAEALQVALARRPEEAEALMRVSREFKRELSEHLQSSCPVPDTDDVARRMVLGVATTAIRLGAMDGVLWEITGRGPMAVNAGAGGQDGLSDDLDALRSAATGPDTRMLARTCVSVARLLPEMMARGGEARRRGGLAELLRRTAGQAWFAGFGDTRLSSASQGTAGRIVA